MHISALPEKIAVLLVVQDNSAVARVHFAEKCAPDRLARIVGNIFKAVRNTIIDRTSQEIKYFKYEELA